MSKSCKKTIGWVASLLALILVIGIALSLENASASNIIPSYTVKLSEKKGEVEVDFTKIEVTLTNTEDEEDTETVKANSEGEAVFEDFLEAGKSYKLTTSHIMGYEKIEVDINPQETDTLKEIELTKLEKITVSGKIKAHDGTPYKGATISFVSKDGEEKRTTETDGKYEVTLYKGVQYKVSIKPKDEKHKEQVKECTYDKDTEENFSLLGVFKIELLSVLGDSGSVTVDKDKVTQGESYKIEVTPNSDCYLDKIIVNKDEVAWNTIEMGKDGTYTCEITGVKEEQKIDVKLSKKEEQKFLASDLVKVEALGNGAALVPEDGRDDRLICNAKTTSIKIYPKGNSATGIGYKTTSDNQRVLVLREKESSNVPFFELNMDKAITEIEELYIRDKDGKWIEYKVSPKCSIVIDKKKPEVSLENEQTGWTNKKETEIKFKVKKCGEESNEICSSDIAQIYITDKEIKDENEKITDEKKIASIDAKKINQEPDSEYAFTISNKIEGKNTYYIYAEDAAGNRSKPCMAIVQYDKTPPVITEIAMMPAVEGGTIFYGESANISCKNIKLEGTVLDKYPDEEQDSGERTDDEKQTSGIAEVELTLKSGDNETIKMCKITENGVFKHEFKERNQKQTITKICCRDKAGNESQYNPSDIKIQGDKQSTITSNNVIVADTSVKLNNRTVTGDEEKIYSKDNDTIIVDSPERKALKVDVQETGIEIEGEENFKVGFTKILVKNLVENVEKASIECSPSVSVELTDLNLVAGKDNKITITANMNSGQTIEKSFSIYYDSAPPEIKSIKVEELDERYVFSEFGTFYNNKVKISVTANDNQGIKKIRLLINGKEYQTLENNQMEDAQTGAKLIFEVPIGTNGQVCADAWDLVGNRSKITMADKCDDSNIAKSQLMIEDTTPTITCSIPEAVYNGVWYASDTNFTVQIDDKASGLYSVKAILNGTTVKEITDDYRKEKTTSDTFQINTTRAKQAKDGSYNLRIEVEDNAGNRSVLEKKIYVDYTRPEIVSFEFEASGYKEGNKKEFGVKERDYGYYFRETTKVTVCAKDVSPSSGLQYISYYMEDKDGGKTDVVKKPVSAGGEITFEVPANFKGQIYANPTDNVNHSAEKFVTPDSTVIEDSSKHKTNSNIDLSIKSSSAPKKDKKGLDLYKKDVTILVQVRDDYSGIRKVEYSVTAPYDKGKNHSGEIVIDNKGKKKDNNTPDWQLAKKEKNLVTKMTGKVKVSNNSNNIVIRVKMTDRAGHMTVNSKKISIDKTKPVIKVTYDNNKSDKDFKNFYKNKRTAKIVVTERNFNPKNIKYSVTNKYGGTPKIKLKDAKVWKEKKNKKNPDRTTYTAKIPFEEDGEYTWDFSFKDRAGNKAAKVSTQKFVIDRTEPVITISYDNDNAQNSFYYKKHRTATIVIDERNFEESRIKINGRGQNDGKSVPFPPVSEWSKNGNTYTATISYTQDAEYTFEINYTDKAGNKAFALPEETFVIDKTIPEIEITEVEDKSANKGKVAPVITYRDVNMNTSTVRLSLSGCRRGKIDNIELLGEQEDIKNGGRFTFHDFEKKKEIDDIYTLTASVEDKAGNKTPVKTVTFSVNRFGSNYLFESEPISSIVTQNQKGSYPYIRNEFEIVLKEVNVDELQKEMPRITMTKNGTTVELSEDKMDYKVEHTGGGKKWKTRQWSEYTYYISSSLFSEDALYGVEVFSRDNAGNRNENTEKKAAIQFTIDKTEPLIIPIDLQNNKQYPLDSKNVKIVVKDNFVTPNVKIYLNDREVQYEAKGEDYFLTIPSAGVKQNLKIEAVDFAGNKKVVTVADFLVSTNIFVRWYNNLPLFASTLAALAVLVVLAIVLIIVKKMKKEEGVQ